MEKPKETRYIVRILNKDLKGNRLIPTALQGIKGVGQRMALSIARAFEKEHGISVNARLGEIPEELDKKLEEIVAHPERHGLPGWMLNRRKDFETGQDWHVTMADLDFALRKDLQRLNEIKSYRGLRLSWGLTVRGQKTKSTHRGKGGVIGVTKKEVKAAAAAAKTQAKPQAAEKKK